MAVVFFFFLFLLLAGEGFPQCYSDTACSGSLVPAANQRECCAGTDEGLAYSSGGTCNLCIGMLYNIHLAVASNRIFVQFMGLLKLCMIWMRILDWTLTSDSM